MNFKLILAILLLCAYTTAIGDLTDRPKSYKPVILTPIEYLDYLPT